MEKGFNAYATIGFDLAKSLPGRTVFLDMNNNEIKAKCVDGRWILSLSPKQEKDLIRRNIERLKKAIADGKKIQISDFHTFVKPEEPQQ